MQLVAAKALCGCIIFLVTLVCGTTPFLLLRSSLVTERPARGKPQGQDQAKAPTPGQGQGHKHGTTSGRVNSLQCFACGVFLATCLLQLLPEAREAMEAAQLPWAQTQPVTEMIVSLGFLLLLVTENAVLACHDVAQDPQSETASSSAAGEDSAGKEKKEKKQAQQRGGARPRDAFAPAPCLQSSCENPDHPGPVKHGFPSAPSGLSRKAGGDQAGVVIFSRHFSLACKLSDLHAAETTERKKRKIFSDPSLLYTQKSYGTVKPLSDGQSTMKPLSDGQSTMKPLSDGQSTRSGRPTHGDRDQHEGVNVRADTDRKTRESLVYNENRPNHHPDCAEDRTRETDRQVENDEEEEGEELFIQPSWGSSDSSLSSHADNSDTASLRSQDSQTSLVSRTADGGGGGNQKREESEKEKKKKKMIKDKKRLRDQKAAWKSLVLLMALSLHTVFDGLMVGLQDNQASLWTLLGAVALHKALVAASVSLSLFESHHHHPRATLTYLSLFSLVAPAGLAVGTLLTETSFDGQAQSLTSGVLQSLAAGTFMYVTFVESLQGRFEDGTGSVKMLNVALLLLGFGLVFALKVVLPPT